MLVNEFRDYPSSKYRQGRQVLEGSANNLPALFLTREFSPTAEYVGNAKRLLRTANQKPLRIRREITLQRGLGAGVGQETILSGPDKLKNPATNKSLTYPLVTPFNVADLTYEPTAGISGRITYRSLEDGREARFTIHDAQIRFDLTSLPSQEPLIVPIMRSAPRSNE